MEKSKLQQFEKDFLEFWTKEWADKFEKKNERGWVDLLLSGKPFHLRFFVRDGEAVPSHVSGIVDPVMVSFFEDEEDVMEWEVRFLLKNGIEIKFNRGQVYFADGGIESDYTEFIAVIS
ncbi:MAG: hypothetical protein WCT18_02920 [Patescibacteria group bacterium]